MSLRTLLVPLDGSAFGEHALPLALAIARRAAGRIELVHVLTPRLYPGLGSTDLAEVEKAIRDDARAYLNDVIQRVAAVSPVPVTGVLLDGRIADRLCEHAVDCKTDLVVLSTHGQGPLSRFWLGSVADELVRRMPVPLILVRPGDGKPDFATDPIPKKILVPLDGSELAEKILEPVVALGTLAGADYRLLRVVPPVLVGGFDSLGPRQPTGGHSLADQLEAEAKTYLKEVGTRLQDQIETTQMGVVLGWPPAQTILDEAQLHGADLIALATQGRQGLSRLFLGSVADKVVRGATVPVLLHRSPATPE